MRPQDAVHKRAVLHDALEDPYMHRFFDIWINRDAGARYAFPSRNIGGREFPWTGEMVSDDMKNILRMAETWYVSSEVMQIVEAMRIKMPPEVMHREDPPSTHGFMLFEDPWLQTDIQGKSMPIRALLWSTRIVGKKELNGVEKPGLAVWCLIDFDDNMIDDYWRYEAGAKSQEEHIVRTMVERGIQFTPASIFSVTFGSYAFELADHPGSIWILAEAEGINIMDDPEEGVWRVRSENTGETTVALAQGVSAYGDSLRNAAIYQGLDKDKVMDQRVKPEPIITFLQALWRFQSQELVAIERPHIRKTAMRQLLRRQFLDKPISVILWRKRAQSPETGDREYELSHRFVVRGHWRRQWYPSESRHKSIYIKPFLKGPENAPILMRERVNAVIR